MSRIKLGDPHQAPLGRWTPLACFGDRWAHTCLSICVCLRLSAGQQVVRFQRQQSHGSTRLGKAKSFAKRSKECVNLLTTRKLANACLAWVHSFRMVANHVHFRANEPNTFFTCLLRQALLVHVPSNRTFAQVRTLESRWRRTLESVMLCGDVLHHHFISTTE